MADSVEEEISELRTLFWSERDPQGRAFAPLADAYRRQGDLDQALDLLQDGISRHATFTPGHIVAAWVQRDRGDVEAAADAYGTALALDEENTEALRGLGEVAVARGEGAVATMHYQKLIELEPGDLEIVARLREIERFPSAPPMPSVAKVPPVVAAPVFGVPELAEPSEVIADPASPMDAFAAEPETEPEVTDDLPFLTSVEPDPIEPEAVDDLPLLSSLDPTPEPIEAGSSDDADEEGPITRTMADLYARQGLNDRALRVYRRLLERAPEDTGLVDRVAEMSALVAAAAAMEAAGRLSWPTESEEEAAPFAAPQSGQPADVAPRAPRRSTDDEMETLAEDWARGPHATGELSTPFAWTARQAPSEPAPSDDARPVREYFRTLLEWEPVEAVEAVYAAPPEPEVAIEPLIEPRIVPEPVLEAPIVVLETLEVSARTESEAVPVETLAPGLVVPIESLAPDGIVPIETLAPVVVDISSLAP